MNHRPFEDWLHSNEPLTTEQKYELKAHMQTCRSCASLAEVNAALRMTRQASPAPGFSNRFQARLAAKRAAEKRRNLWGVILMVTAGTLSLSWLVLPYIIWAVTAPVEMFSTWLSAVAQLIISLQAFSVAGSVIFRVASGFVPPVFWGIALSFLAVTGSLWILMFRKISPLREGVRL